MKNRKLIALIATTPDRPYQQRVMCGVFSQCEKYGYDVAVFSMNVLIEHYFENYFNGEFPIYDLPDFGRIDGVIVMSLLLTDSNNKRTYVLDNIANKFNAECKSNCKIVSLDYKFGEYEVIYTDDRKAFKEITSHIIDVHKCKNIFFLSGPENGPSSDRLAGYIDFLNENEIPIDNSKIFYGDFWYTSGEKLADDIFHGNTDMPEAVICASDHMAIGLANRLISYGIKIPEQIIVTGYDATSEAALNATTITSYSPHVSIAAAKAVNAIHRVIEPDVPLADISEFTQCGFKIGESCGCDLNTKYIKECNDADIHHYYSGSNIYNLLDNYVFESIISAADYNKCLKNICSSAYIIKPFDKWFLCLKENWINLDDMSGSVYTPKMKSAIIIDEINNIACCSDNFEYDLFDYKLLVPCLHEERETPSVFYFSPIHSNEQIFGYSVLMCGLNDNKKIDYMYKNWLRYINSALEMMRIRTKVFDNSIHDVATGLYNRRGLFIRLDDVDKNDYDNILVIMADMDGLKNINDTYGHNEGDFGIFSIAKCLKNNAERDDICVRNGGDEFLLISIGNISEDDVQMKISSIKNSIKQINETSGKPYEISASFGYCIAPFSNSTNIDDVIHIADEKMYADKKNRRR